MRVLLVEDDPAISRFLLKGLREEQHLVDLVEDGLAAEARATAGDYDLILLDLMLPGLDGFSVCQRLRDQGVDTPILVITARDEVADRVRGLDTGADDYLVKPFDFDELLARIRALSRRGRGPYLSATLAYGPIAFDQHDHRVLVTGVEVSLTATDTACSSTSCGVPNPWSRATSWPSTCGAATTSPSPTSADVYIGYLRRKLGPAGSCIQTVRGLGYMLKSPGPR